MLSRISFGAVRNQYWCSPTTKACHLSSKRKKYILALWNFLDRVLAYNITLAHVPGRANAAADFLSRMETEPGATLQLGLTDSLPVREIKVSMTAKTPDISINELQFNNTSLEKNSTHAEYETILNNIPGIKEKFPELTNFIREKESMCDSEYTSLTRAENNALHEPDPLNDFEISEHATTLNLKAEQSKDPALRKVRKWLEENSDIDITYETHEIKKYAKHHSRLVLENGIIYRKFFNDVGIVSHLQYCVPKHLRSEILYRLHNSPTSGHLGINKTVYEFRKRFYFPSFTEYLLNYVKNCSTCLQTKNIQQKRLGPPPESLVSDQNFPGDMMQIDLVGQFDAPVYKYALTAIDDFSKYLFAVPLSSISAENVAKALVSIFLKHSYIPKTILADLGTGFTSKLMHELTNMLEIKLNHASLKHAQTVDVVERAHSAFKRILKINSTSAWSNWHKFVNIATFVHNTSYHVSIGTTPSLIFHGREPLKPIDLRFSKHVNSSQPSSDFVNDFQDNLVQQFCETKSRILNSYHRYRNYYDRKAEAQPLKKHEYC